MSLLWHFNNVSAEAAKLTKLSYCVGGRQLTHTQTFALKHTYSEKLKKSQPAASAKISAATAALLKRRSAEQCSEADGKGAKYIPKKKQKNETLRTLQWRSFQKKKKKLEKKTTTTTTKSKSTKHH